MARKLKVFRTAAGFHDAYVAAPSRKAALAAWGADADLFARGIAEEVTDAALTEEPLAHPGEVIKRSRGSAAEQLAALPVDRPKRTRGAKADPPARAAAQAPKPSPKPTRDDLDAAQAAIDDAERDWRETQRALARRQAALDRERRAATEQHDQRLADLVRVHRRAKETYDAALARWRDRG